jgi:transcriptional regulator of acetoin/glycerol metabolism
VRELQNAMEYASVVGTGEVLTAQDLPPEFREPPQPRGAEGEPRPAARGPSGLADEESALREALRQAKGSKGEAARLLGLHRATLWRKMQKHGL